MIINNIILGVAIIAAIYVVVDTIADIRKRQCTLISLLLSFMIIGSIIYAVIQSL
jgi:hypothetical protein